MTVQYTTMAGAKNVQFRVQKNPKKEQKKKMDSTFNGKVQ